MESNQNSVRTDENYDLIKVSPRLPLNSKQKEKRGLIQFIIRHLERDEQNFVYATRFKRKEIAEVLEMNKLVPQPSWWVYGPKDILDWYDWFD